jgi:hypothetical protein
MTKIVTAMLGNNAGIVGAAALARLGGVHGLSQPLNGAPPATVKTKS